MAKTRSPRYPAIGLKEAVDKVQMVYNKDYQNALPRKVAAEHMGYASLNGKSLGVLSALIKYGLLEGRGDDTRVSDLAVSIIAHPRGSPERFGALATAAGAPELFAELDARFSHGKASDQAIRAYLLTQKFIPAAADTVVRAYRETKQLVDGESKGYNPELEEPKDPSVEAPMVSRSTPPIQRTPQVSSPSGGEPFRVTFLGNAMEIAGRIDTRERADELVEAINALKVLLPRPSAAEQIRARFKEPEYQEMRREEAVRRANQTEDDETAS